VSFRSLLAALVAVFAVTLQSSMPPVDAQASPTIHLLVVPLETDATAYYAADLGLYAKYGLNVDVQVAPTGAAIAAAITGGAAEIGYANLISIAQAVESGIPFGVVLPCSTYSSKTRPTTLLIVDKNGPIHVAKDLNGKTLGVNGIGSLQQLGPMMWMDKNGGDSKSVHWLDMTPAEEPAALAQGRVAAISVTEPMASMSVAQGGRVLANEFVAIAPQFVTGAWFTSRTWATAHPDLVTKLQRALSEAAVWANAHPKESGALLVKDTKLAPETVATMARTHFAESADPVQMRPEIAAAAQYGVLKAPLDGATLLLQTGSSGG
jgi:NitT/TauT family transport system substrate-binding protein